MTRKYLVEAEARLVERESDVTFASDSLERQLEMLDELLEDAEEAEDASASSAEEELEDAEDALQTGFDKLKEEIMNHQNIVVSDNNVSERIEEIFEHLMHGEGGPGAEKIRTLVGEIIGYKEESVVEKQRRQFGDDISKNQEAPDDEPTFTPTERMVEEIEQDAAAAIDTIHELELGTVSKEACELEVE
jgi:predicted Zn-dependent peptidase